MENYQIVTLRERADLKMQAAQWFHSKWGVPVEAYLECMEDYLSHQIEYGWELHCMAQNSGESTSSRLYIHK